MLRRSLWKDGLLAFMERMRRSVTGLKSCFSISRRKQKSHSYSFACSKTVLLYIILLILFSSSLGSKFRHLVFLISNLRLHS